MTIGFLLGAAFFTACAHFAPDVQFQELMKSHRPAALEAQKGLEVSVQEFASPTPAKEVFDADLALHGVLALFLRIDNGSALDYEVRETDAKSFLGDRPLPQIRGVDAANQAATKDAAGRAAAWTAATGPFALIFWPVTISVSASHTREVNQTIEHYFQNLEFGKVLVKPNQKVGGFLFFRLPAGVKTLENLKLEITALKKSSGEHLNFQLSLPAIELSSPVSTPGATGNSEKPD